jgi:hypothetical protein
MNSLDLRHPESDFLLPFLDGELPRRKARQVRLHVEACWQCRTELVELQKLVADCVRYRENVAAYMPPPPKAWADLSRAFDRLDESPAVVSLFRRTAFRWALLGVGAASLVAAGLALHVIDFRGSPELSKPLETPKKELPDQPASPASTITRADGVRPSVPGRASVPEKAAAPPASVADELRAVAVLHRLGADLGEPVEVARSGAYVVVGGTGVAPGMQRQIREALVAEPNVLLRFTEPVTAPPVSSPPARDATLLKGSPGVPSALEAQVGGRAQLEALSTQLLDRDEAAMARVYALRRLAEQFPAEAERQLSPGDQQVLKDLGRQHVAALAREAAAVTGLASPLLSPSAFPEAGQITDAASWQRATQNLFASARQVETLLPAWLGVTAPDRDTAPARPANDLPRQLSTALAQFQIDVQQCERLLKP